jgi:hypothetical protein
MNKLAEVLETRVRRGEDGEPIVEGGRGNIHRDGAGFSLYAGFKTPKGLNRCRESFAAFAELRQVGDTEAVWHLATVPTPDQARTIRDGLKLRKRRFATPGAAERLRAFRFARSPESLRRLETTICAESLLGQPLEISR